MKWAYFEGYLSLSIGDPQKLDGCLEKLTAKFILKGATRQIISSDKLHWGLHDLCEGQGLPVNHISLHCDALF